MPLYLAHLDKRTRELMLEEVEYDIQRNQLYIDPVLSGQGVHDYPNLLRDAIESGDETTLAQALDERRRIERTLTRRKPSGGYTISAVSGTAAQQIAEGEFNRYYICAVARRAIDEGIEELVVYRAKPVKKPRPESEEMVETTIDPHALLEDLRTHTGEPPELGVPAGYGSSLSVRFP